MSFAASQKDKKSNLGRFRDKQFPIISEIKQNRTISNHFSTTKRINVLVQVSYWRRSFFVRSNNVFLHVVRISLGLELGLRLRTGLGVEVRVGQKGVAAANEKSRRRGYPQTRAAHRKQEPLTGFNRTHIDISGKQNFRICCFDDWIHSANGFYELSRLFACKHHSISMQRSKSGFSSWTIKKRFDHRRCAEPFFPSCIPNKEYSPGDRF